MKRDKEKYYELFNGRKPVIGMIHLAALPGTPLSKLSVKEITLQALNEAELLISLGVDSIMLENMHDVPYLNRNVGEEIIATFSVVANELRNLTDIPLGIQILAGANKGALAVAKAAGLDFIRAEGFVFSHIADEGLMNTDAGELLRYRKQIEADNVLVFTDIKKKHSSHSITADVDIAETAKAAEFFLSDGLIVTGKSTGSKASLDEVKAVYEVSNIPVLIGSGLTPENVKQYLPFTDGLIVGSYFKIDGKWFNPPDKERVEKFLNAVKS